MGRQTRQTLRSRCCGLESFFARLLRSCGHCRTPATRPAAPRSLARSTRTKCLGEAACSKAEAWVVSLCARARDIKDKRTLLLEAGICRCTGMTRSGGCWAMMENVVALIWAFSA